MYENTGTGEAMKNRVELEGVTVRHLPKIGFAGNQFRAFVTIRHINPDTGNAHYIDVQCRDHIAHQVYADFMAARRVSVVGRLKMGSSGRLLLIATEPVAFEANGKEFREEYLAEKAEYLSACKAAHERAKAPVSVDEPNAGESDADASMDSEEDMEDDDDQEI